MDTTKLGGRPPRCLTRPTDAAKGEEEGSEAIKPKDSTRGREDQEQVHTVLPADEVRGASRQGLRAPNAAKSNANEAVKAKLREAHPPGDGADRAEAADAVLTAEANKKKISEKTPMGKKRKRNATPRKKPKPAPKDIPEEREEIYDRDGVLVTEGLRPAKDVAIGVSEIPNDSGVQTPDEIEVVKKDDTVDLLGSIGQLIDSKLKGVMSQLAERTGGAVGALSEHKTSSAPEGAGGSRSDRKSQLKNANHSNRSTHPSSRTKRGSQSRGSDKDSTVEKKRRRPTEATAQSDEESGVTSGGTASKKSKKKKRKISEDAMGEFWKICARRKFPRFASKALDLETDPAGNKRMLTEALQNDANFSSFARRKALNPGTSIRDAKEYKFLGMVLDTLFHELGPLKCIEMDGIGLLIRRLGAMELVVEKNWPAAEALEGFEEKKGLMSSKQLKAVAQQVELGEKVDKLRQKEKEKPTKSASGKGGDNK